MEYIPLTTEENKLINPVNVQNKTVLFFDGICNLCSRSVDFVMQNQNEDIYYMALQSPGAVDFLARYGYDAQALDTVYLYTDGKIFTQKDAIGRLYRLLKAPYSTLGTIILLSPKWISNSIYKLIARNRYSLMGKKDTCRIPAPAEMHFFLPPDTQLIA